MKKLICVLVVLLAMTLGSAFAGDAAEVCVNSVNSFELCPGTGWMSCAATTIVIILLAGAIVTSPMWCD